MSKISKERRALLGKVHIAKKELGLDDDIYRMILDNEVGKTSASKCTDRQLVKVIEALKSKGWKNSQKKKFRSTKDGLKRKIYALWGELQKLGAVQSKDKTALDAFVKKHTGIDSVSFLDENPAIKMIEILKAWIERVENEQA
jgi:phage gp16-like protein